MLSNEQKQTLSYVKEMFNDRGGCIKVPIDALSVLGENKCDNNEISIIPEWELAYFEDNKNCEAFLYVPLRINYSEYNMNSELRVLFNKNTFYRMLLTSISFEVKENEHRIVLYSSIDGGSFLCELYKNDKILKEIKGQSKNSEILDISYRSHDDSNEEFTTNDDITYYFNLLKSNKPKTNLIK